ncbi:MAG: 1-phosphofructokinase [Desulfobulbaceae bacterium]|nr:1-phosphofructokinase [Desulfobulbaceae bacterium]
MIYTVTLNPALDRTISIKNINPDDCNRVEAEQLYAGGKGIDVSKVLTKFGVKNKALGFVGGFAGEELEGLLINEGIACDFVRIAGRTRTNIIVNDIGANTQTLFNAKGPSITAYELMQIIHKIENLADPRYVVISGSLPLGVNPEIYRKIIEIVKGNGAKVILDTDGEALLAGVQELPNIIKPNIHELSRLAGRPLDCIDAVVEAALGLHQRGIEIVLVSMGSRGIVMISASGRYLVQPPEVEVKNKIGAGDSAVAGFVYGLCAGKDLVLSLTCAVAAGTATILQAGTALCNLEDFRDLQEQLTPQKL